MTMPEQTDAALLQKSLRGDPHAFGELIQRYRNLVFAAVLQRVGRFADAEDVAQETFIEAHGSLSSLREPGAFAGWLHTIACRRCSHWIRAQRSHELIDDLAASELVDKAADPEAPLDQLEMRQLVLQAISCLPEKVAETVVLYYIDSQSYTEIARFLDVPVSTVKGRLQMGRRQLKEEFIIMVEETLTQSRPDDRFSERVLQEIVRRTQEAVQRNAHDEALQLCDRALGVLGHLDATTEHSEIHSRVLQWQGGERTYWQGRYQDGAASYQRAARTAANTGDHRTRAECLLRQMDALARMGVFDAVAALVPDAKSAFADAGD
jgi:RNA polymerase sigma-70 factor, ECF subfamily